MTRWSAKELESYRLILERRHAVEQAQRDQRLIQANELAARAAALLKEKFQADRVVLFGSLVHGCWFSPTSDIDLAVWGLDALTYLTAVAQLQDLDPAFKIDLIRMECCNPELEQVIVQEGRAL